MVIHTLSLDAFRAHAASELRFSPKLTVLCGPNGAGKTNVLEAIHYLAMTKSFLASQDQYALRKGHRAFELEGRFTGDSGATLTVHLGFSRDEGKRILLNRAPLDRVSDVIGRLPVVTYAPSDIDLTAGAPEDRRRFINHTLSQARPAYLDDLFKYRRTLRQRNVLLSHRKRSPTASDATLDAWTAELAASGARIVAARSLFVRQLQTHLENAFRTFGDLGEEPEMAYRTTLPRHADRTAAEIAEELVSLSRDLRGRESALGRSLFGPHLDDLSFALNGLEVRRYASRGQHRTFGLALKIATYFYLAESLDEKPILLLDDVEAELDTQRAQILTDLLVSDAVGQSVVTTPDPATYSRFEAFNQAPHRIIRISGGRVETTDDHAA